MNIDTLYSLINKSVFNSSLPQINIELKNRKTKVLQGYLEYWDGIPINKTKIIIYKPWNPINVLSHEIVHVWQYKNDKRLVHNTEFKEMENKVLKAVKKIKTRHKLIKIDIKQQNN